MSGPALSTFGVNGTMPDPKLSVFSGQTVIANNSGWGGSSTIGTIDAAVGAFALINAASGDSALAITLSPGPYSVQATSASGTPGSALIELYEVP